MSGLRTVEDQLARVLAAVRPLPAETLPVLAAGARTTAAPVVAAADIPPFDNSAMDGFAVREADARGADSAHPVTLRVVADLPAGVDDDPPLGPGEAARIMTGSPVPSAADAVVPFEDSVGGLGDSLRAVQVLRAPAAGAYVRRRGADVRSGDEVVPAGARLGPFALAAAVAAGVGAVTVTRRPRVVVVSTGSELLAAGAPLTRGRIPDSNGPLLAALVADADADVVRVERVPDDPLAVTHIVQRSADADVLLFSGGVSAGAYEPVRGAFAGGGDVEFTGVAMQPGKPQAFGVLPSGALVFGLPGNPVSVAVSFEVFVRPALLALQGRRDLFRRRMRLTAAEGWRTPPGRRQYLPAAVDLAAGTVRPATAGGSGSHLAGGLARAEAFAVIPAEVEAVASGDAVDVMLVG